MIDSYGREISYLRLSVTELCNLRCQYCMPESGVVKKCHEDMLTEEEMVDVAYAAASLGIKKVRITGGEPLIKKNIVSICDNIASVPGIEELCITTNGILLPELAKPIKEAGVSRVNISLDTLDEEKYAQITRCGKLKDAFAGLEAALDAGFDRVKINTVLLGDLNENEILSLAQLTLHYPIDVRFIELMPMSGNVDLKEYSYIQTQKVLEALPDAIPVKTDLIASLYALPNAKGQIGLISPLSHEFCGRCNRIRVTADGKVKPCLHSEAEFMLKGLSREKMAEQMKQAIACKPVSHEALSYSSRSKTSRFMSQIGG